MKRRTHFAVKGCANCRSWRVAWNARNRVERERDERAAALERENETLRAALAAATNREGRER